ncbi:MAG: exodeoxyribonuclease III [Gammaproteobacteria bacterium]|nr:exodeoxyribonuclease III [Gammaproteobacteria bacterium]
MRVITANVNGIRAAAKKGFFDWLKKQKADVVCIQETKAQEHQLKQPEHDDPLFYPKGFYSYYFDAEKKGYSGVALYSRKEPDKITMGLGWDHADTEGRYIQADFGKLSIASLYLPSGSSSDERQANKLKFMDRFMDDLKAIRRQRREFIICGDYNIVHKEIDIKNWKSNQKNSGCTPEERAWLDVLFYQVGFVDAFREVNKKPDQYTWWSNRGNARANNVGWRIDYQIITPGLKDKVKKASIYKDSWFSDHAPLIMDYDIDF